MKKQKLFTIISLAGVVVASIVLILVIALAIGANSQGTKVLGTADRDGERLEIPQK